ncbi:MAG: site-2 protease family protein, partial [Planctomycetes bacterium]|nr:site-2 protease family protein [Planctomycetota bacterium]
MSLVHSIMRDGLPLGRLFRIPVTINPSLIPIAVLLALGIGRGLEFGFIANASIAAVMVVVVFGSILLHELGHALVARRFGIETRTINLHLFGGVAQIMREPARPAEEFWIAVAGPAVSLGIAALLAVAAVAAALVLPDTSAGHMIITPVVGGMVANGMLGVFNLLPGYPMDGGRIVRAWLWHRSGDLVRATIVAATVGEWVGFALIGVGVVRWLVFGDPGGI